MSIDAAEQLQTNPYMQLDRFAELVSQYPDTPKYMMQWGVLESYRYRALKDPDFAVGLVDYAAQPGPSLLARSYALDIGISGSARAVEAARKANVPANPECDEIITSFREAISRKPFLNRLRFNDHGLGDYNALSNAHFWFFKRLAESEGISPGLITPDAHDMGYEPGTITTEVPEAAALLLGKLIKGKYALDINQLSPKVANDALELALDFRGNAYQQALKNDARNRVAKFAKLGRFTTIGGDEHDAPVDFLYGLSGKEQMVYTQVFNELYESVQGLHDVFPTILGEKVTKGARALLANALFAVQAHIESGNSTHTSIALKNGGELAVDFEADEPLLVLQGLNQTLRTLHETVIADNVRTILAARGNGFQVDRFIDIKSKLPSAVSLYTRPYEAVGYDDKYEYGRPGVAVEASISFKIQVGDEQRLSPIDKLAPSKDIISIRLDREHDDVISLDVGSVLGNPQSFGTKVGRLLAWGNSLRAAATGQKAGLNHVKDALDQQYGQPEAFAKLAKQMRAQIDDRRATHEEFKAYVTAARDAALGTLVLSN